MRTAEDLPHRIQEAFHVVEQKNGEVDYTRCCQGFNIFSSGTVYLEEKARPSQDLSTLPGVSATAEVKARALLGNRELRPLLPFHHLETSPSNMEADSARSFKKTVDGDENVKFHTCHGSGEASI